MISRDRLRFRRMRARLRRGDGLGILATTLLAILINLVVSVINPFGMDDAIKTRAGDILQLVTSHGYGGTQPTRGQQAVSVILIDEPFLRLRAGSDAQAAAVWPMPVQDMTGLIHRIVRARPAAVFIDLAFPDAPREVTANSANSREQALEALGRGLRVLDPTIPVFIAEDIVPTSRQRRANDACAIDFVPREELAGSLLNARSLRRWLYDDPTRDDPRSHIQFVDASWTGNPAAYPLAPLRVDREGSCAVAARDGTGYVASPALALAAAFWKQCRTTPTLPGCPAGPPGPLRTAALAPTDPPIEGVVPRTLPAAATRPMAIRWGYALSPRMRDYHARAANRDDCVSQFAYNGWWTATRNYLEQLFAPAELRARRGTGSRCAYIDTVSAAALYDARRFEDAAGDRHAVDATPDAALKTFVENRVVLVGSSVSLTGDVFESPINGPLPGVYNHAAAVENLITMEDRYKIADPDWSQKVALTLLTVFLLAAMPWAWQRLRGLARLRFGGLGEHILAPIAYTMVLAVVGGFLVLWLTARTRLPLADVAMPVFALHLILGSDMVANWQLALRRAVRRWLKRIRIARAAARRGRLAAG